MNSILNRDLKVAGRVVESNTIEPRRIYGRSKLIYSVEIEPLSPDLCYELAQAYLMEAGPVCDNADQILRQIGNSQSLCFESILRPRCVRLDKAKSEFSPGSLVVVACRFEYSLLTSEAGYCLFPRFVLRFVDEFDSADLASISYIADDSRGSDAGTSEDDDYGYDF